MSESILDFHEIFADVTTRTCVCQDVVLLSSFLERQETRIWFCSGKMSTWGFLNWMKLSYLAFVLVFGHFFTDSIAMVNHQLLGEKQKMFGTFSIKIIIGLFTTYFFENILWGSLFPGNFPEKPQKSKEMVTSKLERQERVFPPLESSKKRSKGWVWGGAVCKKQLFTERTNFTNNTTYIGVMIDPCTKYQQGCFLCFEFVRCFIGKVSSFPLRSCEVFIQAAVKFWCREPSSS